MGAREDRETHTMAEPNGGGRPAPLSRRPWPARRRPPQASGPAEDVAVRDRTTGDYTPPAPPDALPESAPMIEETPPPGLNLAPIRLAALGLALVLAIAITMVKLFVAGPPSVDDLRAQAGVDSWTELPIGVKDDQPGVAFHNPDGSWSGFDIDVAYMIAEDLGFRRDDVRFYGIESEDRARMQATDGKKHRVPVKLVIASYSITPAREQMTGVTFSAPYLFTEQSVMTLAGHARVSALEDLRGRDVCTLSTSTSEVAPDRAGAIVHRKNRVSECFDDLRAKRVDAVTTDAAILAGYQAAYPGEFAHWDLGLDATEAWGVNVGENEALQKLVDLTLYRSLKDPKDDRWEQAFERNLQVEEPANPGTPIAVAQQPAVPEPDVRELPWERVAP
jgi:glutamate transport system substrate-binding protein